MQLIPKRQRRKMLANGVERAKGGSQFDPQPVVKLFMNPASVWLLDSISPYDDDVAYGFCDLGVGCPEWGSVSLKWLAELNGGAEWGFGVERDIDFEPKQSLRSYARIAIEKGYIEA